jgi:hypothetical protein
MPNLSIPLEQLAFIIEKAREFDVEVPAVIPDDASNPTDDEAGDTRVLEDRPDNPAGEELKEAIDVLNDDQRDEIVALMWVGRGDYTGEDWQDALHAARERRNGREASYLMGTPLLGDYLEEGAISLGYNAEDLEPD